MDHLKRIWEANENIYVVETRLMTTGEQSERRTGAIRNELVNVGAASFHSVGHEQPS